MREAHVPTQQSAAVPQARVPPPHVDPQRPRRAEGASGQGPSAPVGLIWSITDRRVFTRLHTDGIRIRYEDLWVRWLPDPSAAPVRVAYAIGRSTGPAVTRNRIRRRLRELVRHEASVGLPSGYYLIGAGPTRAAQPAAELARDVARLFGQLRSRAT
jgi:ribonuclease P protein component